jgi:hypothetical protein
MVSSIRSLGGNRLMRAALVTLFAAAAYGSMITLPTGLTPGTQYQLVFVTADTFDAGSTSIATYNRGRNRRRGTQPNISGLRYGEWCHVDGDWLCHWRQCRR